MGQDREAVLVALHGISGKGGVGLVIWCPRL